MAKNEMMCDCEVIHKELVESARQEMLSDKTLSKMVNFYKAFADGTRIKIINVLKNGELCVCDISSLLNMTKSAISHQLKYLRELNLVKSRKEGKEVWYSLADNHVQEMFNLCLVHINEEI